MNIVNEQNIHITEALTKLNGGAMPNGINKGVSKFLRGKVTKFGFGLFGFNTISNRLHKMCFA
jgi:hypothetical protein